MDRLKHFPCTLRDLDRETGFPKGTAFRAFKASLGSLAEGEDFLRLDAGADRPAIEDLKAAARVYPASIHVVLLSGRGCRIVREAMEHLNQAGLPRRNSGQAPP
jgi:hypothetical protein